MEAALASYLKENREQINTKLQTIIENNNAIPENLLQSMLYSVQAGGKRLRPILLHAAYESFGGSDEKALSVSCALEMIHTYSLIHDDLPAMDDDDYRRGKLTNHKKFDEATAILAGDALLTMSFETITEDLLLSDTEKVYLIGKLAKAAGAFGMVGGQILDMEAENREVTLKELENIHHLKTGRLITYAITAGAYLAGANDKQLQLMEEFGSYLGLLFQIQDDILDVSGEQEIMGKPVGSDEHNNKSTYPKLLGMDGAKKQLQDYVDRAKKTLTEAGIASSTLRELTDYLSNRDH